MHIYRPSPSSNAHTRRINGEPIRLLAHAMRLLCIVLVMRSTAFAGVRAARYASNILKLTKKAAANKRRAGKWMFEETENDAVHHYYGVRRPLHTRTHSLQTTIWYFIRNITIKYLDYGLEMEISRRLSLSLSLVVTDSCLFRADDIDASSSVSRRTTEKQLTIIWRWWYRHHLDVVRTRALNYLASVCCLLKRRFTKVHVTHNINTMCIFIAHTSNKVATAAATVLSATATTTFSAVHTSGRLPVCHRSTMHVTNDQNENERNERWIQWFRMASRSRQIAAPTQRWEGEREQKNKNVKNNWTELWDAHQQFCSLRTSHFAHLQHRSRFDTREIAYFQGINAVVLRQLYLRIANASKSRRNAGMNEHSG